MLLPGRPVSGFDERSVSDASRGLLITKGDPKASLKFGVI